MKKLENSNSFAVAPQVILISNMCAKSAWETWSERPPRKIPSRKIHLKFSKTVAFRLLQVLHVRQRLSKTYGHRRRSSRQCDTS